MHLSSSELILLEVYTPPPCAVQLLTLWSWLLQDVHRALAGARALGAEHYRFPVTPGSINALLLHPQMCQVHLLHRPKTASQDSCMKCTLQAC